MYRFIHKMFINKNVNTCQKKRILTNSNDFENLGHKFELESVHL